MGKKSAFFLLVDFKGNLSPQTKEKKRAPLCKRVICVGTFIEEIWDIIVRSGVLLVKNTKCEQVLDANLAILPHSQAGKQPADYDHSK